MPTGGTCTRTSSTGSTRCARSRGAPAARCRSRWPSSPLPLSALIEATARRRFGAIPVVATGPELVDYFGALQERGRRAGLRLVLRFCRARDAGRVRRHRDQPVRRVRPTCRLSPGRPGRGPPAGPPSHHHGGGLVFETRLQVCEHTVSPRTPVAARRRMRGMDLCQRPLSNPRQPISACWRSRSVRPASWGRRPGYYALMIPVTIAAFAVGFTALILIGSSWWALAIAGFLGLAFTQLGSCGARRRPP